MLAQALSLHQQGCRTKNHSNSLKILLLSHQLDFSGAPLALLEMARVLTQDGHFVTLLSLKNGVLRESFDELGVDCRDLREAIQKPDLVIANTVLTVPLSHRLRAEGIRTLNWIHESKWFFDALRLNPDSGGFNLVTEIIVPSQFMVAELTPLFPNALFGILPNLVDLALPEGIHREPWVVIPGSWELRKGQEHLLEIMQREGLDFPVKFLGAQSRPLSFPRVSTFTGQVDHQAALQHISSAKMVVSPAISETQNLTALEAIGRKTPVLLSDIPAHREISAYFGGLPLFNPKMPSSLRRGLLQAAAESIDEPLLNRRVKLLRERFGIDIYRQRIREIIDRPSTRSHRRLEPHSKNGAQSQKKENYSLSVITVVLRPDTKLLKTYYSILPLLNKFPQIEWVVKSATQTDFILLGIQPHTGIRIEVSRDHGIYEAMNQASRLAKGQYLMFIGSGDILFDQGISRLIQILDRSPRPPNILFFSAFMDSWGREWYPMPEDIAQRMSSPHAGIVIERALFNAHSGYLENYKIAGDYDLVSRCLHATKQCLFWKSAIPLARCEGNGVSVVKFLEAFMEETLVRIRVWGVSYEQVALDIQNYLKAPFAALIKSSTARATEAEQGSRNDRL